MSDDLLPRLLQARSTLLSDTADSAVGVPERLLVRCDAPGTMQVYELAPGETPRQLTALPEPVGRARYVPGRREAVLEIDEGGNERHGLYLLDLEPAGRAPAARLEELQPLATDPRFGHHLAGISPDGRRVAYLSNRENGIDFDLWLCEPHSGENRLLWRSGSYCQPASGFSPDGRLVSVLRPGDRSLDEDLVLVDVADGTARTVLAHPGTPALVGSPAWLADGRMLASSDAGRDYAAILVLTSGDAAAIPLPGTGERGDADVVASPDGATALIIENVGGWSTAHLRDAARLEVPGADLDLPEPGVLLDHVVGPPRLSADGRRIVYSLTGPRLPGDVFVHDRDRGTTRRLTDSRLDIDPAQLVAPEAAKVVSFDGEVVPLFVYRPPRAPGPPPVVVMVHGGPEAQARPSFSPVVQALALRGYAVVVPNVRGSTGYGRRFAGLDDGRRRLDSVRDLAAVHGWLADAGLDPDRAALWGGSYGGYMVLAGLAFHPELWAAGVDIVGISDLETFLENTSAYRRRFREHEYGSLEHDRDFLAAASPLRRARDIRAPLFVIHGRNDPRVPVAEAEQLVSELAERGIACELVIYEDEGHGLARLDNRLDAYPRAIAFLDQTLRRPDHKSDTSGS